MRFPYFFLPLFLLLTCCKNQPSTEKSVAAENITPPTPLADSSIVEVRAIDFYEITKAHANFPIIDIRPEREYKTGHLYRAINIPQDDPNFLNRIASLGHNQEYLVYCADGYTSLDLANKMKVWSFKRVYVMKGGLINWGEAQQALQLN
jgi:rhodanese-related sulfurtransferase